MKNKLVIDKKGLKGEDGYRTFSIRIKQETVEALDKISNDTNRSRNDIINLLLEFGVENCEVKK